MARSKTIKTNPRILCVVAPLIPLGLLSREPVKGVEINRHCYT